MRFSAHLLKKRYSLVDVFLLGAAIAILVGLYSFRQWSAHSLSLYDHPLDFLRQHSVTDPDAKEYMRQSYANIVAQRDLKIPSEKQDELAKLFHELDIWAYLWWMGIRIQKNPCDLWMIQQIIYEVRPDYIIETGTFRGGSALYFVQMLEGMGLEGSEVITIDIRDQCQEASKYPIWQKRVKFIHGSSTDPKVVAHVRQKVKGKKVMVVLDSNHSRDHVLKELQYYAPLVSPESYVVVEDTNLDSQIVPNFRGPLIAVQEFLKSEAGKEFSSDVSREAMVLTFNPGGWLRKNGKDD